MKKISLSIFTFYTFVLGGGLFASNTKHGTTVDLTKTITAADMEKIPNLNALLAAKKQQMSDLMDQFNKKKFNALLSQTIDWKIGDQKGRASLFSIIGHIVLYLKNEYFEYLANFQLQPPNKKTIIVKWNDNFAKFYVYRIIIDGRSIFEIYKHKKSNSIMVVFSNENERLISLPTLQDQNFIPNFYYLSTSGRRVIDILQDQIIKFSPSDESLYPIQEFDAVKYNENRKKEKVNDNGKEPVITEQTKFSLNVAAV